MCVKEFYGYICGHCSVPYLRKCPITSADVNYPACEHPAERPIFTDANCHPCSRVVWNKAVLEREEHHRMQHKNGECDCEVIFDNEERERRAREKLFRGQVERLGDERHDGGYGGRGNRGGRGGRGGGVSRGGGFGGRNGPHRFGHSRDGYSEGGNGMGPWQHGSGVRYRGNGGPAEYSGGGFRNRQPDQLQSPASQHIAAPSEASSSRYDWAPEAKNNAYQYHGYSNENSTPGGEQAYGPPAHIHPTGLMMGQRGAGMKWYEVEPPMPPPLQFSAGVVLPPLPPPASGFDSPAYQAPRLVSFNPSAHQAQAPVLAYPIYPAPTVGSALIYQKAMSEPSTGFGNPVKSTRTANHQTSYSSSLIARAGSETKYEQISVSGTISDNTSTPTMLTAKQDWDDDNASRLQEQEQQAPAVVHSDAGEGSSA